MDHALSHILLFLSTFIVGAIFVNFTVKNNVFYKNLLSFSGAFLFGLTVLHFIPELFYDFKSEFGIVILLGFSFQIVVEFLTQGLDHGHYHSHGKNGLSWSAIIGLFVHSIFEASPLAGHEGHDHSHLDQYLLWGLILHKIPVAIFLATVAGQYFSKKWMAYALIAAFALMSPIGLFLSVEIEAINQFQDYFMAFVVGIFLYISTTILYEITENHNFNTLKFVSIMVGFSVAVLSTLLG